MLVRPLPARRLSEDAAALVADYAAFDRGRASRRQILTFLAGLALVILLGTAIGKLLPAESLIAEGVLVTPALGLVAADAVQRRHLVRRLDRVRADVQTVRKS